MRFTIKQYHNFGDLSERLKGNLISSVGWDILLTANEDKDSRLFIPVDRKEWISKIYKIPEILARGKRIAKFLADNGFQKITSVGVGGGYLEYVIKSLLPQIYIKCSDFAPQSVKRLRKVFIECEEIDVFDILNDEWPKQLENEILMFYRVDTEFSDLQWKKIFKKMYDSNVLNILFAPNGFLTFKKILVQKLNQLKALIDRKQTLTFAGYLRTEDTLRSLWEFWYDVKAEFVTENMKCFWLKRKIAN